MTQPYDVVFYHQFLDAHPMWPSQTRAESELDPRRMVRLAIAAVHRAAPLGRPVLITNEVGGFAGLEGLTLERRHLDDPATLQLDRTRCYRDYLAARAGHDDRVGAIFLDTDALVLRELAPVFAHDFDVAVTYLESSLHRPVPLDHWGLPTDGRLSAINFGVMAARFTTAAVGFFDAALERYGVLAAEGAGFVKDGRNRFRTADRTTETYYRIDDVRTWGGGQFALTSLLSEHLFGDFRPDCQAAGAAIRLLPAEQWNYSPAGGRFTRDMLDDRFVLHLKGTRKAQFEAVAAWLR